MGKVKSCRVIVMKFLEYCLTMLLITSCRSNEFQEKLSESKDGFSLSDECCYPLCLAVTFYSPTYFSICLMACKKIPADKKYICNKLCKVFPVWRQKCKKYCRRI